MALKLSLELFRLFHTFIPKIMMHMASFEMLIFDAVDYLILLKPELLIAE